MDVFSSGCYPPSPRQIQQLSAPMGLLLWPEFFTLLRSFDGNASHDPKRQTLIMRHSALTVMRLPKRKSPPDELLSSGGDCGGYRLSLHVERRGDQSSVWATSTTSVASSRDTTGMSKASSMSSLPPTTMRS